MQELMCFYLRLKFESEQKKEAEDRLNKLETAIANDTDRLTQLEQEKEQLLRDKRLISDQISGMQNTLDEIKESFDEKTDAVNAAKRKLSQVTKEIERMMKEIVNKVFFERN
jgi:predicted  nucleic acid-binding Zn-ribbon protein